MEISQIQKTLVLGLTILAHPDPRRIGERAVKLDLANARPLEISRLEPLFAPPDGQKRRPLGDPHLSRRPVILTQHDGSGFALDLSQTSTRVACEGRPVSHGQTVPEDALELGVVLTLSNRIALLLHFLDPIPDRSLPSFGLVGESHGMLEVRRQILRVAELEISVLLRGETGTGKEIVAHAIHQASARRQGPFLAINMGAIPPSLAAAELFGNARGAFTGADRKRKGYFRRASGGTLLLDEIGEAPPDLQVLLLRTLETGIVQPVGEESDYEVDTRILAATDAHLERAIANDRFRAPLLHRLSGYEIQLPPLRRRREDIARLLFEFLSRESVSLGDSIPQVSSLDTPRPWLPTELVVRLVLYAWPGNVRQLRNVARQLLVGSHGATQLRTTPEIEAQLEQDEGTRDIPPWLLNTEPVGKDLGGSPDSPNLQSEVPSKPRFVNVETHPLPSLQPERTNLPTPAVPLPTASAGDVRPLVEGRKAYRSPHDVSEDELLSTLRAHQFRLLPTAHALGISRSSLYNLVDQCSKVRKAVDLEAQEIQASRAAHQGDLDAMAAALEVSRKGLSRRITELGL